MKKTVRVTPMKRRGVEGVLLQTPFDLDFVKTLKAMVPWDHRWFVEQRSGWWVSSQFSEVVVHLASERFGGASIVDENGDRITVTAAGERCRQEQLFS